MRDPDRYRVTYFSPSSAQYDVQVRLCTTIVWVCCLVFQEFLVSLSKNLAIHKNKYWKCNAFACKVIMSQILSRIMYNVPFRMYYSVHSLTLWTQVAAVNQHGTGRYSAPVNFNFTSECRHMPMCIAAKLRCPEVVYNSHKIDQWKRVTIWAQKQAGV